MTTNLSTPTGFRPQALTRWNRYYIPQSDPYAYRVGDVVRSGSGTDATGVVTVIPHPGSAVGMRGVIVSVDPGLPATGGLQSNGQKLSVPAVKTRDYYVWVADDPEAVYIAVDDGITPANLIPANVNSFVTFTPGVAGDANGNSTSALTSSSFGGAAGSGCWKVLGLVPGSGFGARAQWLVQSGYHELSTGQPPGAGSGITALAQASDWNTAKPPAVVTDITAAATAAANAQSTANTANTAAGTAQTTASNAATAAAAAQSTANAAATKAGQQFPISFNKDTVTDGTVVTIPVPFGMTLNSVIAECGAGTTTLTPKKNGTAMTGTPVSVSTTKSSQNYTGGNTLAAGDDLTFVASSTSSCTGLAVTALYTRALG